MVPTMLEAAILEWILQHNPLLRSYRLEIVARDWTGVGCFTYFRGGGNHTKSELGPFSFKWSTNPK